MPWASFYSRKGLPQWHTGGGKAYSALSLSLVLQDKTHLMRSLGVPLLYRGRGRGPSRPSPLLLASTRALASGARGYLTKDAGREEVAAAIRTAATGQVTFTRDIGEKLAGSFSPQSISPRDRFPTLTAREAEVLTHMVAGRSNTEIAQQLFLAVGTVKSYTNDIFTKLGAQNRAHAIALATGRAKNEG